MITVYRCSFCNFESQDEQETIEHEKSHAKQIECVKIQKKDVVSCVMGVLDKQDSLGALYELTFTWNAVVTNKETARTMSSVFQVSKDAIQGVFSREYNSIQRA